MTVSNISKQNYYELIVPHLSETKRKIYEIICHHPRGINSVELAAILGKDRHKFSGRLTDLLKLDLIKIDRLVEIDGSTFGVWINNIDEKGELIYKPKL